MKVNWVSRTYRTLWNWQDAVYIGVITALVLFDLRSELADRVVRSLQIWLG